MTTQTTQDNLLPFPCSDRVDFYAPMSDDALIFHAKRVWAQIINKAVLGIRPLTDRDKQCIREINAVCISAGYKPLHHDFENL